MRFSRAPFPKLLALLVALVLVLAACAPKTSLLTDALADGTQTDAPARRTIPYGNMQYARPDAEALKARLGELTQQLAEAPDYAAVQALDEEISTLVEAFSTQRMLAYLATHHDVTDTVFEEELAFLDEEEVELQQLITDFNRELVEGPYAEDYRAEVGDYIFEAVQTSLLFTSEAVKEYQKERNRLNQEYTKNISIHSVNGSDGKEYTYYDIWELTDYDLLFELYDLYMEEYLEYYAQLYARMIELDKKTAEALGFESAAAMYYMMYNRDYSPADAMALLANVEEYLAPLMPSGRYNGGEVAYDKALSAMGQALEGFGPELAEAWDYMLEYDLYDMEAGENKRPDVAFTGYLPAYDAPFIYQDYDGSFLAADTIMHEFGHFYNNWLHYNVITVDNLDIAEVYSQGLELLMLPEYEHFTDTPDEAEMEVLSSILESGLLYQSALEEFQLRAYELEEVNSATLGALYAEVRDKYGFAGYYIPGENGTADDWFTVPHFFDNPFYTVSYITSATAALQIWVQQQTDWDGALETYQTLIHADQNQPFAALLAQAGLKAPMDEGVLEDIAQQFTALFAGEGGMDWPNAA